MLLAAGCGGEKRDGGDRAALDVPAALAEARKLAESTWPDARLAGIRIGEEALPETRKNTYAVRLAIELESDPTDPTAKSAAIVCAPKCTIRRAKVDAIVYDWPGCEWREALAAARAAGLASATPVATYGSWSGGPVWQFRERDGDPPIELDGATCAKR